MRFDTPSGTRFLPASPAALRRKRNAKLMGMDALVLTTANRGSGKPRSTSVA